MSNFGKLIISRCNGYYKAFHDLDLMLVKGNRNIIDIDHLIGKLVINGHSNEILIKSDGDVGKITIRGNNNKIYSIFSSSLNNLSDFGRGNEIYYRENDESDKEEEEEDDEQVSPRLNMNLNRINELIPQIQALTLRLQELGMQEIASLNNEENNILNELVDVRFKNVSQNVKE